MRGNSDDRITHSSAREYGAHFTGREVLGRQMDTGRSTGQSDICARVDEQPGMRTSPYRLHSFMGQCFQVPRTEVFFTQLNVVHTRRRALSDLVQQLPSLFLSVAGKLAPVGDVVKQHQLKV